jgi:rSAM/selenodomain-associated transferase 2
LPARHREPPRHIRESIVSALSLSIIIPTLNEATLVAPLLRYLCDIAPKAELIVSDGDSTDETVESAKSLARCIIAPRGRAAQMNAGARVASGDVLWFVHADCRPHRRSVSALQAAMADASIVGGGFQYSLDCPGYRFRLAERLSNRKNRLLKLLYGDMGMFVRKDTFERLGGFKDIPLMEDMEFSRRLKKAGRIAILPLTMKTSARRWIEEGWTKNSVRSWLLQGAWAMGVSPHSLARWYRFK